MIAFKIVAQDSSELLIQSCDYKPLDILEIRINIPRGSGGFLITEQDVKDLRDWLSDWITEVGE